MNAIGPRLEEAAASQVAQERQWWTHDRRGALGGARAGSGAVSHEVSPTAPRLRRRHHRAAALRGKRFSSLSRARAFARKIGGKVRRWRRKMPGREPWRSEMNPWAAASVPMGLIKERKQG